MKVALSAALLQISSIFYSATHADAVDTVTVACGGGIPNKKCPFEPTVVSKTEKYGARCCSPSPFYLSELKSDHGCTVYGGTVSNIPSSGAEEGGEPGLYCPWSLTYAEAETYCANLGARLCTEEELANKCAKSTGCKLNGVLVWSKPAVTPAPTASPTKPPTALPTVPPTKFPTATPTKSPTPKPTSSEKLTAITIHGGTHVNRFYFEYNYGARTKMFGNPRGGNAQAKFNLQADEKLVRIWGYDYMGGYMGKQINFITSKGRTYKYGSGSAPGNYYNFEKWSGRGITDCVIQQIYYNEFKIMSVS
eukprot:CAMPEP_0203689628 /NCGR_PEP_ID=MMETSP0091-20130426/2032_1 /ASSEMBLY_ACC=CAM_ASM_001089 /TAXON_ID=426623 /ORGANISM="Chaetoceros affinis, Strain CCMP159" /LENGTH=306 /DNA_ID=CAMNT_0050559387 /DNA_START=61 /DNA_END=981 /DNA_ORIENTATION=+